MPIVSIIIPNLNSPTVDRTIEALKNQSYPGEYEIIIVGQDRYALANSSERVRIIHTAEPVIQSIARNIGILNSCGDILVFTDSDCIPLNNWLESLLHAYDDAAVMVVGGSVIFPASAYWNLSDNLSTFHEFLPTSNLQNREQLPSNNLSLRRTVLEDSGLFDENRPIAEDADLTTRIRRLGYQLNFSPAARVTHITQRNSLANLLQHAYHFGKYSIKIDPLYRDILETPWILRHTWPVLLLSPVIATGVIFKMFWRDPWLWKFWYTIPAIFLAKIAWCIGAWKSNLSGYPVKETKIPKIQS